MTEDYIKLIKYVNCASDLAEFVRKDIQSKSRKVSNDTVLALSKFISAAGAVETMLDFVESKRVKLN